MEPTYKIAMPKSFWNHENYSTQLDSYSKDLEKKKSKEDLKSVSSKSREAREASESDFKDLNQNQQVNMKFGMFLQLGKCNFTTHDSLRMANVDSLHGITRWSGGYLSEHANFTSDGGVGNPFTFLVAGNPNGGLSEYLLWRRMDSYGIQLTNLENHKFYDEERLTIIKGTETKTRIEVEPLVTEVRQSMMHLDLVVVDLVHDVLNTSHHDLSDFDLMEIVNGLDLASQTLTPEGFFVLFLRKPESKVVSMFSQAFEKIWLYKPFTSFPLDKHVVLVGKGVHKDLKKTLSSGKKSKTFSDWYSTQLRSIEQFEDLLGKNMDKYSKRLEAVEKTMFTPSVEMDFVIPSNINVPRVISAWGLNQHR